MAAAGVCFAESGLSTGNGLPILADLVLHGTLHRGSNQDGANQYSRFRKYSFVVGGRIVRGAVISGKPASWQGAIFRFYFCCCIIRGVFGLGRMAAMGSEFLLCKYNIFPSHVTI